MTVPAVIRKVRPGDLTPEAQAALAARVGEGDRSAEEELAHHFQRRIIVMMLSRVRDVETARDLTQEVLMAVVLGLRKGQIREGQKLAAFVHGTARNVANGFFRSRSPDSIPLAPEHATMGTDDIADRIHRARVLGRLLDSLEPSDRRILELTLTEGLKPCEIAERLGLSSEVVRARKSRAIKRAMAHVRETSAPGEASGHGVG